MAFKLDTVRCLDVTVMELTGRVSLGEGAKLFRDAVRNALWDGQTKLALDYSNVTYQDSSALGELLSAFTTLANSGGELVIFNLSQKVRDLLQITKLFTIFTVFDSRDAALEHFAKKRASQFLVTTRRFTSLSVLALSGCLDETHGASKLIASTNSALELGAETVVLLCRQVFSVDRFGIEALLAACQAVRRRGGTVVLAGVEDPVRAEIAPAIKSETIPLYATLDDALSALGFKVSRGYQGVEVARA